MDGWMMTTEYVQYLYLYDQRATINSLLTPAPRWAGLLVFSLFSLPLPLLRCCSCYYCFCSTLKPPFSFLAILLHLFETIFH